MLDGGNKKKNQCIHPNEFVSVIIAEVSVGAAGPPSCVRSFAAAKAQLPAASSG